MGSLFKTVPIVGSLENYIAGVSMTGLGSLALFIALIVATCSPSSVLGGKTLLENSISDRPQVQWEIGYVFQVVALVILLPSLVIAMTKVTGMQRPKFVKPFFPGMF